MKILYVPIAMFAIAFAIAFALFAAAPSPGPSGEFVINTNQSTNLNCNYVRVVGGKLSVDELLPNWRIAVNWEAWRTNGKARVVDRGSLDLTMAQLKTILNSTNAKTALKNTILSDVSLTEKP